jgi:hypothetical protein
MVDLDEILGPRAEAIIEWHKQDTMIFTKDRGFPRFPRIYHKWGATGLTETTDLKVNPVRENNVPLPTVAARYKIKRRDLLRDAQGDEKVEKLLELARWTLAHGLVEHSTTTGSFADVMEEAAQASPSDPAVKACRQVQADMKRPVGKPEAAAFWKSKLGNYRTASSDHFIMVHNASTSLATPPEVTAYLKRLEEHYRGFFYWFAARGKALPVPEQQLVAVLVSKPEEFQALRQVFDNPPLTADGYCTHRENLAVFSVVPLDQGYEGLRRATRDLWQGGWSREKLLLGKPGVGAPPGTPPNEQVKNQTLALLQRALEEQSMTATASHVGTVQLAVATGLLPRNVEVPEWIRFGIGSYAETPKGAYWGGVGAPSWKYLVRWKLWDDAKTLEARPEAALKKVVTDAYFRDVKEPTEKNLMLPRTMAWSLTYFLAERKTDGLIRYFDELNNMPRDLEFDEGALLACFGRALDLMDSASPNTVNPGKFSKLANEWYQFLHYTNLEASEAYKELVEDFEQKMKRRGTRSAKPAAPPAKAPSGGQQ